MTNHWRDIQHADVVFIVGANPAECHPVGFKWVLEARNRRGTKIVHVDPRFTRTSAVADYHMPIRAGSDIAMLGFLIKTTIEKRLYHDDYVKHYTSAAYLVKEGFGFHDGYFSGWDPVAHTYETSTWAYELDEGGYAKQDLTLQHPRCVFQLLKKHFSRYDIDTASKITGATPAQLQRLADIVLTTGRPDRVGCALYAVGYTHHSKGVQMIRALAMLQLLLGNVGRPGGGVDAERGHANIQGNTDNAISWEILPGYLRVPLPGQQTLKEYLAANTPKKLHPKAVNYLSNSDKFVVSLLKAWWADAASPDNEFAYGYLPKPGGPSSWLDIFSAMYNGKLDGLLTTGMNPANIGPDSSAVIKALSNLKWLIHLDPFPTGTSEFWRAPGVDPTKVQTEVFMVPTTHWLEKDGSFTNSGRWAQWKDKAMDPPGESRDDHWVFAQLYQRLRSLYQTKGGAFPDPLLNLHWPYLDPYYPSLTDVAKEINGSDLTTGKQLPSFALLKDDGTTAAGNWIYAGSFTEDGNMMARRRTTDPTGMGFYHEWGWSWPLNRRILYNRASADLSGKPWDPTRPGIWWNGTQWVGDVPDFPVTSPPSDGVKPFIMTAEGTGRLFSLGLLVDGPLPEHYEPVESPVENILHPQVQTNPKTALFKSVQATFGTADKFPYVATTYRLVEHEHYVTMNVPYLVEAQPDMFVEIPTELAKEKGIRNGGTVRVRSMRGVIDAVAVVTKRLAPLQVNGKTVYQIGIPLHWGYVGIKSGGMANMLTNFVGDANARTPAFKAFLVDIEKA
jgi:formate dehydrogenase major subunit